VGANRATAIFVGAEAVLAAAHFGLDEGAGQVIWLHFSLNQAGTAPVVRSKATAGVSIPCCPWVFMANFSGWSAAALVHELPILQVM
jgi:hypothetical protein